LKSKLYTLKVEKDDTVASFSTKISQISDQLAAIGVNVDDDDLVQIVVDGLPPSWDTFLSCVNPRENQPNLERLWHDCLQEEGRIQNRSGPSNEENISLTTNTKKGKGKKFSFQKNKGRKFKGKRKANDLSKIRCFNCQKFSHYAKDCLDQRGKYKGKHHACATDMEDEPQRKKARESTRDQDTWKEYYLISILFGTITNSVETWLVDSDASKHMMGYQNALTYLIEKKSSVHVELGDDATYVIQGVGSTSFQLDSGIILHIGGILFVPSLKKNLLSISTLEDKGFRVTFMDGKAFLWPKDGDMSLVDVIGVQEGGLYKLFGRPIQALYELWHRSFGRLHYKALPNV